MNGNELIGQEKIIPPPGFILDSSLGQSINPPKGFMLDNPITTPAGFVLDKQIPDNLRLDGTQKGQGFFGPLKRPDGRVSTELTVGFSGPEFGGKETQVPLLVPTLTKEEIDSLLSGKDATPDILQKAKENALTRISAGKSPFAQPGEQQSLPGQLGGEIGQVVATVPEDKRNIIQKVADAAWGEIKTLGGGFYKGAAKTAGALDFYANKIGEGISKVTGIPQEKLRGGVFKYLQDNWDYLGDKLTREGIQTPILTDVIQGLGQAGFDIPMIMATPGPLKLATHGAIMGGAQEGITGAIKGATTGQIMHAGFGLTAGFPLAAKIPALFGLGAVTSPGGIKEKVAGGVTLAALSFTGRDIKGMARENRNITPEVWSEIEKLPDEQTFRATQPEIDVITGKTEISPTKPVEARLPETPIPEAIPAQKPVVAPPSPKKPITIPVASVDMRKEGEAIKTEPIPTEFPKPEVIPPETKPPVEIVETKPPITVAKPVQEYLGEVKKPIPTERVFTVGQKFASKSGGYFEVTDISDPNFITAKSPKGTLFKFDRKTVQPVEQIKKPLPTLEELRTRTTPLTGKWGQKHYQYLKDQAEAYNKEHLDIPIEQLVMTPLEKEKITLFDKLNVPEGNRTDLWKAIAPFDVAHPKADLEHYTNLAIKKMFDKTKRSINGEWLLKRDLRHKYIKIGEEKVPIESATGIPVEKVSEPMMGEKIKGPEAELMAKETIDQIKERIRLNVAEGPNEQRDIKIMNDAILNLKSHKEIAEDLAKTEAGITEERVRQIFKDNVKYLKDDPKMKNLLKDFTEQNFTYLYCGYPIVPELKTAIKGFVDKIVSRRSNILKEMEKNPLPEEVASDSITKVITALKEAKPIRKEQEILYSKERAQRMARSLEIAKEIRGEKGFYAEKRAFAGELPKTTKFESIRPELMQEDIDNIFNQVKDSKNLTEWEKLPARNGLVKLFAPEGTFVPTEGELKLLNRVFPPEFTKAILSKTATWDKIKRYGYELLNISKTAMATYDLSGAFRQGMFFIGHPKQFFDAFVKMFNYFGSDKAFKGLMEDIRSKPNYDIKVKSGVEYTEMDSILRTREEKMMGANFLEKIPIYGIGVRASNRAFTGFLNKLRDNMFDYFYDLAERRGLNPSENLELTRNIANLVNCGTGRGPLGKLEKSAVLLNSTFFAPRLVSSRIQLLNPVFYIKLDPFTRQEALKTLFSFAAFGTGILTLASLSGLKVGTNPLSADFGKIKVDDTRIDIWGGFSPYVKTAFQLVAGKTISSTTGKITIVGEGYHPLTRWDIIGRFVEQKEAPVFSFARGLLEGQNLVGEKFNISKEISNRFIPMVVQDTIDIYKQDPKLLPLSSLGIFGIGLQTYSKNKIDVLSSRYFDKGDRTAYDEANVYIKSLPVEEQERTRKRFMMGKKIKDIPEEERGYWMFLSGLNPERRAKYFYDKYIEKTGTEKEQMMRDARKIGGILSDRFLKEFKRLQKENK